MMLGLSRGDFGLVLFIFLLVWGAGRLPPLAERIAASWAARRARTSGRGRGTLAGGVMPDHDGGPRRHPSATLFVSDPTVEAEGMTRALRGSGYSVVDVPLSMLVA